MADENAPAEIADNAVDVSSDWRTALPDDIRDNATLSKFKADSLEEFAGKISSSYINLSSHLGRDKIAKPVTESDWDDVYNFLGRPESPDGYEIGMPDGVSDQVKAQFSDERLGAFRAQAHKLGLNADQVKGLIEWQVGNVQTDLDGYNQSREQSITQAEESLKNEWGRAYDQKLESAMKAVEKYGGDELKQVLDQTGLGNHPALAKAFAQIAQTTMADNELIGPTNGGKEALTPKEALDQARQLMSHPAYTDKRHPEHEGLVKKVQNRFERAFG